MQCPLHNQKVNKPGFHGASCQLAPSNILNTQSAVLTNSTVLVARLIYEEEDDNHNKTCRIQFLSPVCPLAIECRSIGSCSSNGLCERLYVLPKLCHLPQYEYGSRDPPPGYSGSVIIRRIPGFRESGSVLILGQVTQYGDQYFICITITKI